MAYDLDLRDTAEVRRRVVLPVAESLLRADELEDIVVEVCLDQRVVEVGLDHRPRVGRVDTLRVAVKACGEWIEFPRRWFVDDELCDAEWFAGELYDLLQDELAESRLAWGELRRGTFEVQPAEKP